MVPPIVALDSEMIAMPFQLLPSTSLPRAVTVTVPPVTKIPSRPFALTVLPVRSAAKAFPSSRGDLHACAAVTFDGVALDRELTDD